jgi:hypothetical protein
MRVRIAASFCLIFVFAALAANGAEPVGLLSRVTGKVQILRAGQTAAVAARTADLIGAGDRITTGQNSEAAFIYCPELLAARIAAGGEVVFEGQRLRTIKGKLSDERKLPSCSLPSLALAAASRQQAGNTRMRGANLLLHAPSHVSVATPQPRFRWSAVDGATSYDLTITDREERVVWRHTTKSAEAEYPADAPPLNWGQKYWWRVTARAGQEMADEAVSYFQMLSAEQAGRVHAAERVLQQMLEDKGADDGPRFLLAFLYDENGMLDEAARLYAQLARQGNPPEWVQNRLAELMAKLGWDKPE